VGAVSPTAFQTPARRGPLSGVPPCFLTDQTTILGFKLGAPVWRGEPFVAKLGPRPLERTSLTSLACLNFGATSAVPRVDRLVDEFRQQGYIPPKKPSIWLSGTGTSGMARDGRICQTTALSPAITAPSSPAFMVLRLIRHCGMFCRRFRQSHTALPEPTGLTPLIVKRGTLPGLVVKPMCQQGTLRKRLAEYLFRTPHLSRAGLPEY